MLMDAATRLSGTVSATTNAQTGQSIVGTGNILSTNVIDLNPTTNGPGAAQAYDPGQGQPLKFESVITAAVAGGTSVEFQLVTADDAALSTNLTIVESSGAIPVASLVAGRLIELTLNAANVTPRRYLGARYVIAGTTTAGAVVTEMVASAQSVMPNMAFKSGYAII